MFALKGMREWRGWLGRGAGRLLNGAAVSGDLEGVWERSAMQKLVEGSVFEWAVAQRGEPIGRGGGYRKVRIEMCGMVEEAGVDTERAMPDCTSVRWQR